MYRLRQACELLTLLLILAACGRHWDKRTGFSDTGQNSSISPSDSSVAQRLLLAIQSDNLSAAQAALDAGFPINSLLPSERTPVSEAVVWVRPQLVKFFLGRGADPSIKGADGKSAYELAEDNPLILKLLNPDMGNEIQKKFLDAIRANQYAEVKKSLEDGADPNLLTGEGETPLTLAVQLKFDNVVRVLLHPNISTDVNKKNIKNESPLYLARKLKLSRIENMLLQKGAEERTNNE